MTFETDDATDTQVPIRIHFRIPSNPYMSRLYRIEKADQSALKLTEVVDLVVSWTEKVKVDNTTQHLRAFLKEKGYRLADSRYRKTVASA